MYHEGAILKQCFNVGCFRRQQYHVVRRFNGNRIQKTYVALGSIRVIETRQHTECLRLRDSNRLWGSVEKKGSNRKRVICMYFYLFEIPGPGHLLFHVLKHWLWQYRYFACKYMLCYPWNGAVYFDLRLWGMVFAKNMLWIYIGRTWSQWKESFWTCFRIHTGRVDNIVTQFLKRYSDN